MWRVGRCAARSGGPKRSEQIVVVAQPVGGDETGVRNRHLIRKQILKESRGAKNSANSVAHDKSASAVGECVLKQRGQVVEVVDCPAAESSDRHGGLPA